MTGPAPTSVERMIDGRQLFKTEPMDHQVQTFLRQRRKPAFALLLEQGLGKTKVAIDSTTDLFLADEVDRLLVIAPNGVHLGWADEIDKHLSDDVPRSIFRWRGRLLKKEEEGLRWSLKKSGELTVLLMNVEAMSNSTRAIALCDSFCDRRTMIVVDESTRIKTPGVQRTRSICRFGKRCGYRRILTGTPVTQSPFDLYMQFFFLDPDILGYSSIHAFKARYGEFSTEIARGAVKSIDEDGNPVRDEWKYKKLVQYRRLPELAELIQPFSVRYRKEDCLDLPEKVYKRIPVPLTPEQSRLYKSMDRDGVAEFESFEVLAPARLARLTKMQQIVSGFVIDENQVPRKIMDESPKTTMVREIAEDYPGKIVFVARFRHEIAEIVRVLTPIAGVVQYHGGTSADEKRGNVIQFQNDPDVRFLVGQEKALIGITLTEGETMVYYSNEFSYEARYQSEDRLHRIGQRKTVVYIDLVGEGTVDERIEYVLQTCRKNAEAIIDRDKIDLNPVTRPEELDELVGFLSNAIREEAEKKSAEDQWEELWMT